MIGHFNVEFGDDSHLLAGGVDYSLDGVLSDPVAESHRSEIFSQVAAEWLVAWCILAFPFSIDDHVCHCSTTFSFTRLGY